MDDDDFEKVPTKKIKLDEESFTESETCIICTEKFTTSGDHKIVSIDCGHVFGLKCIENWLQPKYGESCPTCKKPCKKKEIRPLFLNVKTVEFEDNTKYLNAIEELANTKMQLKTISEDFSQFKLMNKLVTIENARLTEENKRLLEMKDFAEFQNSKHIESTQSKSSEIIFHFLQKIQISPIGGCRVMSYSPIDKKICVSCPSNNKLITGYGVRVVDINYGKAKKFITLHRSMIRNIEFSPFVSTNLMMSCSLDKYLKLTCTNSDSVVSSYECSSPIWSCTWSNNNDIVYAGLANGTIEEIDRRKLRGPVSKISTPSGGPIFSMNYIYANEHINESGLLVTNSKGITFLSRSNPDTDSLCDPKIDTLLMSQTYGGSLVHSAFDGRSCQLLSTFRPGDSTSSVRYLFSEIGSRSSIDDLLYAAEFKSAFGARRMELMSRSCFVSAGPVRVALAANEETASIKMWDITAGFRESNLFPKDVTVAKPIVDICQYSSDPLSFAAINSDNLYLYSVSK